MFMRCPYGESCTHAHGLDDLRLPVGASDLPDGFEVGYVGNQKDFKTLDQHSISTLSGEEAELSLPMLVNQFGLPATKEKTSSMGNDYFKQSLPPPWDNSMHSSYQVPDLTAVSLVDPAELTGPVFRL